MLLNWQGRHFMEINHSRITSYEIANYMIRTKSLLSAKELAAILEKEYPHLDVDKRDVYPTITIRGQLSDNMVYTEKHIRIISVTTAAAIHPVIGSSENDVQLRTRHPETTAD